jgi:outer membrane protein assembly factor BamB
MARLQGRPLPVKRAVFLLLIPIALVLTGCNVWPMYGGGPTHLNYDSSNVITTSDASTLVEAGTTAAATGTNSWITSSVSVASNDMLYATANYAASGDCEGIADPNDFLAPKDTNDPEVTAATNECADTIGELYAYSATGGTANCPTPTQGDPTLNCQPVWTAIPSQTNGVTSSPAVDMTLSTPVVYVGSHDGEVYAYNASNGTLLWQSQTLGGSIEGSLTIANGYVYVPEDYGWVYVFPSTTGTDDYDQNCWWAAKVRQCDPDWGYSTGGNNFSTPAVANGMMYQAAGDHVGGGNKNDPDQYAVYGFNASYNASQCPGTYAPHEYGKPLSAIATCKPAWSAPWQYGGQWNGGGGSPAVASGDVYVESDSNGLLAFSAYGSSHCTGTKYVGQWGEICTPLWMAKTGLDVVNGANAGPTPAVANGTAYIGSRTGKFYAFNASTGALKWSYATSGAIDSSAVVAGDTSADAVVFVGCSDGVAGQTCSHGLFAFNAAKGGSPLWTGNTGSSVDNPPTVTDAGSGSGTGAIYLPSANQTFAFALPTSS